MPANLPPVYHEIEARYRAAGRTEDKLAALEEMLRVIPKHKGTDKLQADLKARISKLRRQPRKKGPGRSFTRHVPKEGAGQVALAGPPNSGKSALVARLTRAAPEVADYPFTTREPLPGMMTFEDIAFQLVDLPPLSEQYVEHWVFDLIRGAELLWIVIDGANPLYGLELTERILHGKNIGVRPAGRTATAGLPAGRTEKPGLLVVTGSDRAESAENLAILRELLDRPWPLRPVSAVDGSGLEALRRDTFTAMEVTRVYTKQPGKPPDLDQPFTLPRGSTVGQLARLIHKDLVQGLKFARIWGKGVFDGQTVQQAHVLADGDVVEIHA
jgi:ribosome-interacting GTPase 1